VVSSGIASDEGDDERSSLPGFSEDRLSARTCVGVTALVRGALVEIDLIARRWHRVTFAP